MKSIISVTIGKPYADLDCVRIPMALNVSIDEGADDALPHVSQTWLEVFLTHATITKGRDKVLERTIECLEDFKVDWSPVGLAMVETKLREFLAKNDLTHFSAGWFEDPKSLTLH